GSSRTPSAAPPADQTSDRVRPPSRGRPLAVLGGRVASHWATTITRAIAKPPIDSTTNIGSTGDPDVVVPLASDVVVSPPPDPVNAGIDAVDVVATVELVVGAGVVAGRAAVVVVAAAADVDVVADGVVVV